MTDNEILIVQVSLMVPQVKINELREQIKKQIKEKVVVLPYYATAMTAPKDVMIKFEKDEIVKELEDIWEEIRTLPDINPDYPRDRQIHISRYEVQNIFYEHLSELKGEPDEDFVRRK